MYSHPKVRLSAHVSWASPAGMDRTLEIFLDNLRRYAAGEQVLHVVDADEGYSGPGRAVALPERLLGDRGAARRAELLGGPAERDDAEGSDVVGERQE